MTSKKDIIIDYINHNNTVEVGLLEQVFGMPFIEIYNLLTNSTIDIEPCFLIFPIIVNDCIKNLNNLFPDTYIK